MALVWAHEGKPAVPLGSMWQRSLDSRSADHPDFSAGSPRREKFHFV